MRGSRRCAVKCFLQANTIEICAPDETLAAAQCLEAGGTYIIYPVCEDSSETEEGGEEEWGGNEEWEPGRFVAFDPEGNQYTLDFYALEALKQDPSPLLSDPTSLRQDGSERFVVAAEGPLSRALGWEIGDVLLSINGHRLTGLEGASVAYTELEDELDFTLLVERGASKLELRYRVE